MSAGPVGSSAQPLNDAIVIATRTDPQIVPELLMVRTRHAARRGLAVMPPGAQMILLSCR
jgi:hypothetical protein